MSVLPISEILKKMCIRDRHSSYVAVPIACDALNAQAVAVREYHYLTAQVMAIKEDKSLDVYKRQ